MRGRAAGERFLDGGLQFDGAVAVEQLQQMRGDIADVAADFGCALYQRAHHRHGMGEVVKTAMMARFAFVLDQLIDVGGDLDLLAAIVTALMLGHDVGAIENAYPAWIGPHCERAPHMRMRDRIVVQVEAYVWRLADARRLLQVTFIWIVGQSEQAASFSLKGFTDGNIRLIRAAAIGCHGVAPLQCLRVQVIKIGVLAGCKEALPYISDRSFDAAISLPLRTATGLGSKQ